MTEIDFLIQRRYADYRHGTGVQLKLFAGQLDKSPLHICWDSGRPVPETYRPLLNLDRTWLRYWPFSRGKGLVSRFESSIRKDWRGPQQIRSRIKPFKTSTKKKPSAYVIVASEFEAAVAREILDYLEAEYVLKVVDFLHLGPTQLPEYPHLSSLVLGAKKIYALTPTIQEVLMKISGRQDIPLLADGRLPTNNVAKAISPFPGMLEIVMVGSLAYSIGLGELARFCTGLKSRNIRFRLNYIGPKAMRDYLNRELPVHYHGALSDLQRDAVFQSMHLAYLPGPDGDPETDYLAHFSFPSRLIDYFWHGLPVVGPVQSGSATSQMLRNLQGKGVWFSTDSGQLVEVVRTLALDNHCWNSSSKNVRRFAEQEFSIHQMADVILKSFCESAAS